MRTDKSKIKTLPIVSLYESETSKQARRVNFGKSSGNFCPICGSGSHQNKTGALCLDVNKNVFYCFSCGAGGSVVDFVMKLRRLDFIGAADYLNNEYFNGTATDDDRARTVAPTFKQKVLTPQPSTTADAQNLARPIDGEVNAKIYELTAAAPDCPDCLAYLDGRGITADLRARWSITTYRAADFDDIAAELTRLFGVDRLRAAGVVAGQSNYFFFKRHRIIIFNRNRDGKFLNIKARALPSDIDDYARRTGGKELNKYNGTAAALYPFATRALYEVPKGSDVLLVEGELDAIAANELADGSAAAVAIGGSGVGRDTYAALLRVIAARGLTIQPNFDADDGGARALMRFNAIADELKDIELTRRQPRNTAKYKDFGDILASTNVTNPDDVAKLDIYFAEPGAYTVRDVATVFNWSKLRCRRAFMDAIKYFGFNASFSDDYEVIKIYDD